MFTPSESVPYRLDDVALIEFSLGCPLHGYPACAVVRDNKTGEVIHVPGEIVPDAADTSAGPTC